MANISLDSTLESLGKCLEDSFYFMMFIGTFCFDVEIHSGIITETLEEMEEHLCRHITNFLSLEICFPYQPRSSSEIQSYLTKTIIHRQTESITLNTPFVCNGLP